MRSTEPRSPVFVRKQCSSQNPYRLMCAWNDPASFQSFEICSILNMAPRDSDLGRLPLHGVITPAELTEEHAQYLDVIFGGALGDDHAHDKQCDTAEERMQQGE